ncbi:hypothetical protein [Mycolicibacterium hassiacum]|uniref:hypothetical protein n=1 Tax=Mycolicibacterium hassiacum TaxID=46351 RepID=UPI0023F8341C|nr:hypothetical protein [Mycolicibacterium hassiacum]
MMMTLTGSTRDRPWYFEPPQSATWPEDFSIHLPISPYWVDAVSPGCGVTIVAAAAVVSPNSPDGSVATRLHDETPLIVEIPSARLLSSSRRTKCSRPIANAIGAGGTSPVPASNDGVSPAATNSRDTAVTTRRAAGAVRLAVVEPVVTDDDSMTGALLLAGPASC